MPPRDPLLDGVNKLTREKFDFGVIGLSVTRLVLFCEQLGLLFLVQLQKIETHFVVDL